MISPPMDNLWSSKEIYLRIAWNMELWDQGHFVALVDDTVISIWEGRGRLGQGGFTEACKDYYARAYNHIILYGHII